MCGIAGYSLFPNVHPSVQWLDFARRSLVHRGPDDSDYFRDDSGIGLVHTRLSIVDLSEAGHQPMISSDSNIVLVFNGEIYNYRHLRAELLSAGYEFRGHSDTEVLLTLYLHSCKSSSSSRDVFSEFLNRLNGIFSFALWDLQQQSLFVARDALGVKPLYYLNSTDGFFFSSEIKAFPNTPLTYDSSSINRYLTFLWCPGDGTPVNEIRKLSPGEFLVVSQGNIVQHTSWFRPQSVRPSIVQYQRRTSDSYIVGTAAHLRQAVHRQLVADVPIGAFLSGGLDSSSVVAFAKEFNSDLPCFTIDLEGESNDGFSNDLPYAEKVAKHFGLPLHVVSVGAACLPSSIEEMVWQLDEPLADPAPLNVFYISRLAREHGIKVLLSGAGGDDLFTGYRRHSAIRFERFWSWLPRNYRIYMRNLTRNLPLNNTLARRLSKLLSVVHLEGDTRLVHYFRWIDRQDLYSLYTPEFRAALGNSCAEDPMLHYLSDLSDECSALDKMLKLEQRFFLADHNLIYTDKMSMAAGVEVRVPFLDLDLVKYSYSIPDCFKHRHAQGKWILKKAMEPYLPHDVIYRPKTGFGAPLRQWLRFELRDWLEDLLSTRRILNRGIFDSNAVHSLIYRNSVGEIDASYTLFSLACLEIWFQKFIDNPSKSI